MRTETESVGLDLPPEDPSAEDAVPAVIESDEEIHETALKRYDLAESAEVDIRIDALDDLKFRAGEQWHPKDLADRKAAGRPYLTINRMPQLVQQITNEQRQNRHSIKVHPVDDKGDLKTAELFQGLIRDIEYKSNADTARDHAFEGSVTGGFGYYRLVTDYVDEMSFDQEIRFKRVRNWFSVFFDPYSEEPDGSDANFAFVVDDMSEDDYRAQHPDSKLAQHTDFKDALGNAKPIWYRNGHVRVAEYFYREWSPAQIALLSDGRVILRDDFEKEQAAAAPAVQQGLIRPLKIVKERRTMVPKVHWLTINGMEVLDKTEWLGKWIPVLPVYGNELYIEGRRILEGIIRHAKDPQRMQNYWSAMQTETIALAPRAPWIAAAGQIKGFERDWEEVNVRNIPVLQYNAIDLNGQPVPPPQRNQFEPPIAAITQAKMISADDMKAVTGEYDASVGNRSNETSGIAIQSRDMQARTSNYHFVDNLRRTDLHAARQIIDLIPKIYDTKRAARIIGEDGVQRIVVVNAPFKDPKTGQENHYKLNIGKYDVVLDTGPTFATRRQEAAASMLDASKSIPQIGQVASDLMVRNMDWPFAQEIADRLQKTLPPGIADKPGDQSQQVPPALQQKMQQQGQLIEALTKQLHEAKDSIAVGREKLESNERIALAKIKADAIIAEAKLGSAEAMALLKAEMQGIQHRLDLIGMPEEEPDGDESNSGMDDAGAQAPQAAPGQDPTGGEPPGQTLET